MSENRRGPLGGARKAGIVAIAVVSALVGSLASTAPALALWSVTGGGVTSTATGATLSPQSAPTLTSSANGSNTVGFDAGRASATLSPSYVLERSTTSDFANPVVVGTSATQSVRDDGHLPPSFQQTGFSKVALSNDAGCGIASGKLYCWGNNAYAELGQGNTIGTSTVPLRVLTASDNAQSGLPADAVVTDVAGDQYAMCASTSSSVYCWGQSTGGQTDPKSPLLATPTTPRKVDLPVSGTITSLTVAKYSACALVSGDAYCWGNQISGQLGTGDASGPNTIYTPKKVLVGGAIPANTKFTMIRAGNSTTCAVAGGLGYCWGLNSSANLGDGTSTIATAPKKVATGGSSKIPTTGVFTEIAPTNSGATANLSTCAIVSGAVYCWGSGSDGALGGGNTTSSSYGAAVTGLTGEASNLSAGHRGFCVLVSEISQCWGANGKGQLATGNTTSPSKPTATTLPAGKTVASVAGASEFRCWLFTNGTMGCAGDATVGRLAEGPSGRAITGTASYASIGTSVLPSLLGCGTGTVLTDGLCSLSPGTTYYYRVSYTIGQWTSPVSPIAALTAAG